MADDTIISNLSVSQIPLWVFDPMPMDELAALRHQPEFKATNTPIVSQLQLPGYSEAGPVRTGRNFHAAVVEGYRGNEIIFACIYHKALALSGVKVRTVKIGTNDEIVNSPYKQLLVRPNPRWSWEDFLAATTITQDLAGIAYYQKIRSAAGKLVQLWPMRPDWTRPVLTTSGLAGYIYQPPGAQAVPLKATDVLALPIYDPLDMYGGTAPVSVLGHAGDTDNAMSSFMANFFQQGGMPVVVLTTPNQINNAAEISRIRSDWRDRYGGWKNWSEPAIMSNGLTLSKLNFTFEEMGFEELDGRNEARICMVLGVPPIIIGAKIGLDRSTFANYGEARSSWWEDTLHPKLRFLRGQLDRDLAPEFGGGIELEWDLTDIPAFQEDENERWARAEVALKGGGVMVDEYREMIGLEPLPNSRGQIFLRAINVIEVPLADLGEPEKATVDPTDAVVADSQAAALSASKDPAALADGATKALPAPIETKANTDPTDARQRMQREKQLIADLTGYFDGQEQRITKVLTAAFNKAAGDVTQLSLDDPFWQNESNLLYNIMFRNITASGIDGAQNALDDLLATAGVGVDWSTVSSDVTHAAQTYTYDLVKGITDTTRAALQKQIAAWQQSGQPLQVLIDALEPQFGAVRAEMIAATEVTRAFQTGNMATWKDSGVVDGYTFFTAVDEQVCELCSPNDGKTFPLDDDANQPPLHPRCRCFSGPSVTVPD